MSYQHWNLKVDNHIAYLTLSRPDQKNRIDNTTLSELKAISESINQNDDVWVVLLQADGDCFSAGVDVKLIGAMMNQDDASYRSDLRAAQACLDTFESISKPMVAALQGYVIGGGMILALCCDFRIAADNVIFGLPEVKRSIGVIMGTQRITRTIGIAHTKELVMLGNNIDADRSLQMGLVNEVVPLDNLQSRSVDFAKQFLDLPPLAVGLCKKIINEGQFLDRAGQDLEIDAQAALLKSDDFKEAITSFFEKRKPKYVGK